MEKDLKREMNSVIDHLSSAATYMGMVFGDYADALSAGAALYLPERADAKTIAGILSEIMTDVCDLLILAERVVKELEKEKGEEDEV